MRLSPENDKDEHSLDSEHKTVGLFPKDSLNTSKLDKIEEDFKALDHVAKLDQEIGELSRKIRTATNDRMKGGRKRKGDEAELEEDAEGMGREGGKRGRGKGRKENNGRHESGTDVSKTGKRGSGGGSHGKGKGKHKGKGKKDKGEDHDEKRE